jgi:hypothetical protein
MIKCPNYHLKISWRTILVEPVPVQELWIAVTAAIEVVTPTPLTKRLSKVRTSEPDNK